MPFITLSGGLTLQIPTAGTQNWDSNTKTNCWQKIADHDHTGGGKGTQIGAGALAANAVTDTSFRLSNNAYLRARNAANSADVNLLRLNGSDVLEIAPTTTMAGATTISGATTLSNASITLSGLTASRPLELNGSKVVTTNTAATFRSNHGIAASGANADITGISGVARSTWSPGITSNSGAISNISYLNTDYIVYGKAVFFDIAVEFDITAGTPDEIYITVPVTGIAHNTLTHHTYCAADQAGTIITGWWRYDATNVFVAHFFTGITAGVDRRVYFHGFYFTA